MRPISTFYSHFTLIELFFSIQKSTHKIIRIRGQQSNRDVSEMSNSQNIKMFTFPRFSAHVAILSQAKNAHVLFYIIFPRHLDFKKLLVHVFILSCSYLTIKFSVDHKYDFTSLYHYSTRKSLTNPLFYHYICIVPRYLCTVSLVKLVESNRTILEFKYPSQDFRRLHQV